MEELLEPLPVAPRAALQPYDFFQYRASASSLGGDAHDDSLYAARDEALSKTSALNRRRPGEGEMLSKSSALNVRYVDQRRVSDHNRPASPVLRSSSPVLRPASPVPSAEDGQRRQRLPESPRSPRSQSPSSPPLSPTSKLNQRYGSSERVDSGGARLAGSRLNQRYSTASQPTNGHTLPNGHVMNGHVNGDVENGDAELATDSLLNRRQVTLKLKRNKSRKI